VESGSADIGIIALSLVIAPAMKEKGSYVAIPETDYPPIQQGCAILKSSQHKRLAAQFLAFVKRPETMSILARYGFSRSQ
jgi:molybdate transport system substrate-binding protein